MAISTSSVPFLVTLNRNAVAFWQWWTGELRALVPKRLAMAFAGDASLVDVAIDADSLVHVRASGSVMHQIKRVAIKPDDAASLSAAIDDLVKSTGRDVRVLVSPSEVLRKKITLPIATEENLLDVVGFDMDRQTPFTADQVYFGARILNRDVQRERIEVSVAAVPRAALEPMLGQLRAAGVSVHSIIVADEVTGTAAPIELLPKNAEPSRRWSNMQRLNVALIACGLLLALAAVVLPIWQKRETVKELIPLSAKVGADFKVTQRVSDEYTRMANEYNFIVGKKHGMYPAVMLLDEITKISPDTTWIQNFELKTLPKTRELQLSGEAASVSKVIESLEQTQFLQNTVTRGQTRPGSRPNIEFFTLASDVKPRPLPAAILADAGELGPLVLAPDTPKASTATTPAAPVMPAAPVTGAAPPAATPPAPAPAPAAAVTPKASAPAAPAAAVTATPAQPAMPTMPPPGSTVAMPPMPTPGANVGGPPLPTPGAATNMPTPPRGGGLQLPYPGSPGSPGTGMPPVPAPGSVAPIPLPPQTPVQMPLPPGTTAPQPNQVKAP